jgi:hypothetical protein
MDRHFGEAAMSRLYNYTLTFVLQPRKNNGQSSVMVAEKCVSVLGMIRCVDLATALQAASTGLLTPVSLRFRRSGLAFDQRKYLPT